VGRLKALPSRAASLAARVTRPEKVVDPFYESAEWRQFIRAVKEQRGYRCEVVECGKDCRDNPRGLIGDHIIERKDGGADFDLRNIMLMCTGCHNRKTGRERSRRARQPT
jgi:5-methylcytosine-specific restriction protein A